MIIKINGKVIKKFDMGMEELVLNLVAQSDYVEWEIEEHPYMYGVDEDIIITISNTDWSKKNE